MSALLARTGAARPLDITAGALDLDVPFDLGGLFGASGDVEALLDATVSEQLRAFAADPRTTSDTPFAALADAFPGGPAPDGPWEPRAYVEGLGARLVPHAFNTASPRYVGHMTAGLPAFARPIARLVVGLHQNPVKVETAKSATALEREALAQLHREVFAQAPDFYARHAHDRGSTLGMITSGGTVANITALWIARNAALGPAVEHDGLAAALLARGRRRAVVVGSALMHYSFDKAADLLGLGRAGLVRVAVDRRGRVVLDAARRALEDCRARGDEVLALVGVAGSTDCGSIDPLADLADLAAAAGVRYHVDAAWGGPLLLSAAHRDKLAGISRADSVTIDGHKQLYLPMGLGVLLLNDPRAAAAIEKQAAYIIRPDSPDLGRRALEGSRPAASLLLHAGLHLLGRRGYAALIDRGVALAQAFARELAARPGLELLGEPDCNIVNYRLTAPHLDADGLDQLNQSVQEIQRDRGRAFVSRTTLRHTHDRPLTALRVVLANPRTTLDDLRHLLAEQAEIAASL